MSEPAVEGNPDISVIIPTCNRAGWLPGAVRSALEQTHQAIEVLVVDDGSTDDTPEVCRALAAQDRRVRLHRQANAGLAAARNAGLAVARGRWVAFLDDDDLWHTEALERLRELAVASGAAAAVCWACMFESTRRDAGAGQVLADPAGYRVRPWPPDPPRGRLDVTELVLRPLAPINAALFDAARLKEIGSFRRELREVEDYDLWLRLSASSPLPVLDEPLALVRRHPEQMSGSLLRMAGTTRRVLEGFLADHPEIQARVEPGALRERLSTLGREQAHAALLDGQRATAARAAWSSVMRRPLAWKSWAYLLLSPVPWVYRALRGLRG